MPLQATTKAHQRQGHRSRNVGFPPKHSHNLNAYQRCWQIRNYGHSIRRPRSWRVGYRLLGTVSGALNLGPLASSSVCALRKDLSQIFSLSSQQGCQAVLESMSIEQNAAHDSPPCVISQSDGRPELVFAMIAVCVRSGSRPISNNYPVCMKTNLIFVAGMQLGRKRRLGLNRQNPRT